jgi:hypothetical protein
MPPFTEWNAKEYLKKLLQAIFLREKTLATGKANPTGGAVPTGWSVIHIII